MAMLVQDKVTKTRLLSYTEQRREQRFTDMYTSGSSSGIQGLDRIMDHIKLQRLEQNE